MNTYEVQVNRKEEVYFTVKANTAQDAVKQVNDRLVAAGRYPSACKANLLKQ